MSAHRLHALSALMLAWGCGDAEVSSDAAETRDTSTSLDAGEEDLGLASDLGRADGGSIDDAGADIGSPDLGEPDAGRQDTGLDPCRPFEPAFIESIKSTVAGLPALALAPAVVLTVSVPCRGTFTGTAGVANLSTQLPVRPDHLFRIGSLTKSFVAATILLHAEAGRLMIDDPIGLYVDRIPDGDLITIRQLLNHSSGIFNYTEDPELLNRALAGQEPSGPEELVATATRSPPYFPPGQGFHYSNTNYILAGLIAERVDPRPLHQQLRDEIFTPLALGSTFFASEEPVVGELARGYYAGPIGPVDATDLPVSWAWAAGALVSSGADVAHWVEALLDGQVLAPASLAEMLRFDPAYGYGLGVGVQDLPPYGTIIAHSGNIPGFATEFIWFADRKLSLVFLSNHSSADYNAFGSAAAQLWSVYPP